MEQFYLYLDWRCAGSRGAYSIAAAEAGRTKTSLYVKVSAPANLELGIRTWTRAWHYNVQTTGQQENVFMARKCFLALKEFAKMIYDSLSSLHSLYSHSWPLRSVLGMRGSARLRTRPMCRHWGARVRTVCPRRSHGGPHPQSWTSTPRLAGPGELSCAGLNMWKSFSLTCADAKLRIRPTKRRFWNSILVEWTMSEYYKNYLVFSRKTGAMQCNAIQFSIKFNKIVMLFLW